MSIWDDGQGGYVQGIGTTAEGREKDRKSAEKRRKADRAKPESEYRTSVLGRRSE